MVDAARAEADAVSEGLGAATAKASEAWEKVSKKVTACGVADAEDVAKLAGSADVAEPSVRGAAARVAAQRARKFGGSGAARAAALGDGEPAPPTAKGVLWDRCLSRARGRALAPLGKALCEPAAVVAVRGVPGGGRANAARLTGVKLEDQEREHHFDMDTPQEAAHCAAM